MSPLVFLKTLITKIGKNECPIMASAMAFAFLGAIVPTLIFLFSVLGMMGHQEDVQGMLIRTVSGFAPQKTVQLLSEIVDGVVKSSKWGLSIVGLLVALWSSSRGAAVIVKGLDRAYNMPLEQKPFWYEPLISISIVLSLGMVLIVVSNLIFFGEPIIHWMVSTLSLPVNSEPLFQSLRWTISLLSVVACSTLIYGTLLKLKLKDYYWRASAIGSVVFTASWLGLSILFGYYIRTFAGYNPVYGSLGGILFLMTWLYLSAMSILVAGEIISILAIPKEALEVASD